MVGSYNRSGSVYTIHEFQNLKTTDSSLISYGQLFHGQIFGVAQEFLGHWKTGAKFVH